jgi:hypothetical protein
LKKSKSQKFQVSCWPFIREFTKPLRFVVLGNGATVALMAEADGDAWCIFRKDARGKLDNSNIYTMPRVRDVVFRELIDQLAGAEKEHLLSVARDPRVTGSERAKIALELARLETCSDELCAGIAVKAEQFSATHNEAEVQEHVRHLGERLEVAIRAETARYEAMRVESSVNE